MILFLTNNISITKPLYLWLCKKDKKVLVYSKKIDLSTLNRLNPTMIISYNYKYIIQKEIINKYDIINLHISYLPYNRGANPNIWSHIDNTPSGVSIHLIDTGIDSGDILVQKKVSLNKKMTLKYSYKLLHKQIQQLFKLHFLSLKKLKKRKKQNLTKGSIHYIKDTFILPNGYNTTIEELIKANK